MTKIVRDSVVEEALSFRTHCCPGWGVHVAKCCVVYLKSYQSTVEAFLHRGEAHMLFQCDRRPSPHVVYVADDIVARQTELLIFNLLEKNDVKIHRANKVAESVDFGSISYRVYIYCGKVVRCEIYNTATSPSFVFSLRSFLGFFPGGRLRDLLLLAEVDDSSVSFSMPSGEAGLRVLTHKREFSAGTSKDLSGGSGGKSVSECSCFRVLLVFAVAGGGIANDSGVDSASD